MGKGGPKVHSKGKKNRTKRPVSKKYEAFSTEGGKLSRTKKMCPKCGAGVYLARHADRESCGKCSYTTFVKKA